MVLRRAAPFAVALERRILTLTLDTPDSPVNVFTEAAAQQLRAVVRELDRDLVDVVVLRSGKPGSFVNGAQLMLANVAKTRDDVVALTSSVREAYRALREAVVPTICLVDGSCFGCGLELTLHADYRLATSAHDTQFHLTEVADYLLVPAFGATQDLPRLIGFGPALDLLLTGEYWDGSQAAAAGLVDRVLTTQDVEEGLEAFVGGVLGGQVPPRSAQRRWAPGDDHILAGRRARIESLPAAYRPSHGAALDLAASAAQQSELGESDYAKEISACAETIGTSAAKAALAFFFARQAAKLTSLRGWNARPARTLHIAADTELHTQLRARFSQRRFRDLQVVDDPNLADIVLGSANLWLEPLAAWPGTGDTPGVYWPAFSLGSSFVEVVGTRGAAAAGTLVDACLRAGLKAVRTSAERGFVTNLLTEAVFAPLTAAGDGSVGWATLHHLGWVESPARLRALLQDPGSAVELAVGEPTAPPDLELAANVRRSLRKAVQTADERDWVSHRSIVDVIAREILGFPLSLGALSRWVSGVPD